MEDGESPAGQLKIAPVEDCVLTKLEVIGGRAQDLKLNPYSSEGSFGNGRNREWSSHLVSDRRRQDGSPAVATQVLEPQAFSSR